MGVNIVPQRTYIQKEQHREQAVSLALAGENQRDIASRLGISPALVNKDLRQARTQWAERIEGNLTELQGRELMTLDRIELEAWEEWERGKASGTGPDAKLLDVRVKVSTRRQGSWGLTKRSRPRPSN
jgi:hypothetical protein